MSSLPDEDWRAKYVDLEKQFQEFQEFSKAYEQELEEELSSVTGKVTTLQKTNEKLSVELTNRQKKHTEDVRKLELQIITLQESYDLSVADTKDCRQKVIALEQEIEKLETSARVLEEEKSSLEERLEGLVVEVEGYRARDDDYDDSEDGGAYVEVEEDREERKEVEEVDSHVNPSPASPPADLAHVICATEPIMTHDTTVAAEVAEREAGADLQRLSEVTAERDAALRDRDVAQAALAAVTAERDAIVATNAAVTAERDIAVTECGKAVAERDAAVRKRDKTMAACVSALAEKEAILAERDTVVAQKEVLMAENLALTTQKEALLAEKDVLLADRNTLAADKATLTAEKDRLAAERDELAAARDRWMAERKTLASAREVLEKELEQAKAQLTASVATTTAMATTVPGDTATDAITDATASANVEVVHLRQLLAAAEAEAEAARVALTDLQPALTNTHTDAATVHNGSTTTEVAHASAETQVALAGAEASLTSLRADLATAEGDLSLTKEKLMAAETKLTVTEANLKLTEEKLSTTEGDLATAQEKLLLANDKLLAAEEQLVDTQDRMSSAESKLADREAELVVAQDRLAAAERKLAGAELKLNAADAARAAEDSRVAVNAGDGDGTGAGTGAGCDGGDVAPDANTPTATIIAPAAVPAVTGTGDAAVTVMAKPSTCSVFSTTTSASTSALVQALPPPNPYSWLFSPLSQHLRPPPPPPSRIRVLARVRPLTTEEARAPPMLLHAYDPIAAAGGDGTGSTAATTPATTSIATTSTTNSAAATTHKAVVGCGASWPPPAGTTPLWLSSPTQLCCLRPHAEIPTLTRAGAGTSAAASASVSAYASAGTGAAAATATTTTAAAGTSGGANPGTSGSSRGKAKQADSTLVPPELNEDYHSLEVDAVMGPAATQTDVYRTVADMVADVSGGRKCCILAYGQTGSGKTHTVAGPGGLVARSVAHLWQLREGGDENERGSGGRSEHRDHRGDGDGDDGGDTDGIASSSTDAGACKDTGAGVGVGGWRMWVSAVEILNEQVADLLAAERHSMMARGKDKDKEKEREREREKPEGAGAAHASGGHGASSSSSFSSVRWAAWGDGEPSIAELLVKPPRDAALTVDAPGRVLRIRHGQQGTYVTHTLRATADTPEALLSVLRGALARRATAATGSNATSSRSHAIVQIHVARRTSAGAYVLGKLTLADLAGSERAAPARTSGARLVEAGHINRSLSTLGEVLRALGSDRGSYGTLRAGALGSGGGVGTGSSVGGGSAEEVVAHVPFRNSKLTYLLQDSLGGDSITAVVVTLSPAAVHHGETYGTVLFAEAARRVRRSAGASEEQLRFRAALQAVRDKAARVREEALLRAAEAERRVVEVEGRLAQREERWSEKTRAGEAVVAQLQEELATLRRKLAKAVHTPAAAPPARPNEELRRAQYRLAELESRAARAEVEREEQVGLWRRRYEECHTKLRALTAVHSACVEGGNRGHSGGILSNSGNLHYSGASASAATTPSTTPTHALHAHAHHSHTRSSAPSPAFGPSSPAAPTNATATDVSGPLRSGRSVPSDASLPSVPYSLDGVQHAPASDGTTQTTLSAASSSSSSAVPLPPLPPHSSEYAQDPELFLPTPNIPVADSAATQRPAPEAAHTPQRPPPTPSATTSSSTSASATSTPARRSSLPFTPSKPLHASRPAHLPPASPASRAGTAVRASLPTRTRRMSHNGLTNHAPHPSSTSAVGHSCSTPSTPSKPASTSTSAAAATPSSPSTSSASARTHFGRTSTSTSASTGAGGSAPSPPLSPRARARTAALAAAKRVQEYRHVQKAESSVLKTDEEVAPTDSAPVTPVRPHRMSGMSPTHAPVNIVVTPPPPTTTVGTGTMSRLTKPRTSIANLPKTPTTSSGITRAAGKFPSTNSGKTRKSLPGPSRLVGVPPSPLATPPPHKPRSARLSLPSPFTPIATPVASTAATAAATTPAPAAHSRRGSIGDSDSSGGGANVGDVEMTPANDTQDSEIAGSSGKNSEVEITNPEMSPLSPLSFPTNSFSGNLFSLPESPVAGNTVDSPNALTVLDPCAPFAHTPTHGVSTTGITGTQTTFSSSLASSPPPSWSETGLPPTYDAHAHAPIPTPTQAHARTPARGSVRAPLADALDASAAITTTARTGTTTDAGTGACTPQTTPRTAITPRTPVPASQIGAGTGSGVSRAPLSPLSLHDTSSSFLRAPPPSPLPLSSVDHADAGLLYAPPPPTPRPAAGLVAIAEDAASPPAIAAMDQDLARVLASENEHLAAQLRSGSLLDEEEERGGYEVYGSVMEDVIEEESDEESEF